MYKKTCDITNLPADTRGQVLHNQAVLSAHRRRVSTENKGKCKKKDYIERYHCEAEI